METRKRSLYKSITWRIIAVLNGWAVAYALTGNIKQSMAIAIYGNVTGFVLYYLHERVWNQVKAI